MNHLSPQPSLVPQTGDPLEGRATFTRFILPLKWKLLSQAPKASAAPKEFFRPASSIDWLHPARGRQDRPPFLHGSRRNYCTQETAKLLYERAQWFVLESPETGKKQAPADASWNQEFWRTDQAIPCGLAGEEKLVPSLTYSISLRPPALILFEAHKLPHGADSEELLATGFLVLEASFATRPARFEDVLRFNEIFRYIRQPYAEHLTWCEAELKAMHRAVTGKDPDGRTDLYGEKWRSLLKKPVKIGGSFFCLDLDWEQESTWLVQPDDRAFTHSAMFIPKDWARKVAENFLPGRARPSSWAGHWIKHFNIDKPSAIIPEDGDPACTAFEFAWALPRTYNRWAHDGTLHGFTPHSCALLGPAEPYHGDLPLALHAGQHYFDLTLLLIYVRCSLFRFSEKLHSISCSLHDAGPGCGAKTWRHKFKQMRRQFMVFENLYQWPLLSNQQQHLEMYELQRKAMDLQELYDEIRREIETSNEVLDNMVAEKLNAVAFGGLFATLLLSGIGLVLTSIQALGPNQPLGQAKPLKDWPNLIWSIHFSLILLTLLAIGGLVYVFKKRH